MKRSGSDSVFEFVHALDETFASLAERPTSFRIVRPGIRRALAGRFPYVVFFADDESRKRLRRALIEARCPYFFFVVKRKGTLTQAASGFDPGASMWAGSKRK